MGGWITVVVVVVVVVGVGGVDAFRKADNGVG